MVIEDPTDDEEKESIVNALEETDQITGDVTIDDVSTASGNYDYVVEFRETQPKPKMRSGEAKVKWHDSENDWEVNITRTGAWRS